MFSNKEEANILSDDEFERIGRRKKTIISIIIFMIILIIVLILAFKFIKTDSDINVKQPEIVSNTEVKEKTEDETVISEKDIESLRMDGENQAKLLPVGRNTKAG